MATVPLRSTVLVDRRGTVRLMLGRTRRRAPLLLLRWIRAVIDSWRTVLIAWLVALGRRLSPLLGRSSAVVVLLTVHDCLCCRCGCEVRREGKKCYCSGEQRIIRSSFCCRSSAGTNIYSCKYSGCFRVESEDAELRIIVVDNEHRIY